MANPKWDRLRPHVVNLTKGRLSQSGEFEMPVDAIDNIVAAIEQYTMAVDTPRVMMHAHGGLVSETSCSRLCSFGLQMVARIGASIQWSFV